MYGKMLLHKLQPKMLFSNQIAKFFDQQHLWKESIIIFEVLYGDSNKDSIRTRS